MVKLAPGPASVVGEVPTGRLAADSNTLLEAHGETLKNRQRMVFNGAALATLVMDRAGNLKAPPQVSVEGVPTDDTGEALAARVAQALDELNPRDRRDDDKVREAARLTIRRSLRDWHGKKPVTQVHLVRIDGGAP